MGSVLMAKKRYVGFKYEHPDDMEPEFDAKGIETIRRDGFPAQQKIEEVCLKLLFRTQDLSQIKEFCRAEWTKILQGRVSIQDFIVAKEVRLGSYSYASASIPASGLDRDFGLMSQGEGRTSSGRGGRVSTDFERSAGRAAVCRAGAVYRFRRRRAAAHRPRSDARGDARQPVCLSN